MRCSPGSRVGTAALRASETLSTLGLAAITGLVLLRAVEVAVEAILGIPSLVCQYDYSYQNSVK